MMIETVLVLGVFMSISLVILNQARVETKKQQVTLLASEIDVALKGAQRYVGGNYSKIMTELFDLSATTGTARTSMTPQDLVDKGYFPELLVDSGILKSHYDQEYRLLMRLVNRNDTTNPQATMSHAQLSPLGTTSIDPSLLDGDRANGEVDVEAFLVTSGAGEISLSIGGDVTGTLKAPLAGFVREEGFVEGISGTYRQSLASWSSDAPGRGSFAVPVALSRFGVLGDGGSGGEGGGHPDAFRRCEDVDPASALYQTCLTNNDVFSNIIMRARPFDTDGDGVNDGTAFPGIRNLSVIECANTNTPGLADNFIINCADTTVSGNLRVNGDAVIGDMEIVNDTVSFHGKNVITRSGAANDITVSGDVIDGTTIRGDNIYIETLNGGQNIAEGIYFSKLVGAREVVPMPQCPAGLSPAIFITPSAYVDPNGRSILGVRAYFDEVGTDWRIRMFIFVDQDLCTNTVATAIPSNVAKGNASIPFFLPPTNPPGGALCTAMQAKTMSFTDPVTGVVTTETIPGDFEPVTPSRLDGNADVYELYDNHGYAIVQARCE